MANSVSLSFRVSKDKARSIERLAKAMERPKSWIIERAVESYLDLQAWQIEHIERGLSELDSGKGVSHEKVAAWLKSWGSARERKPPRR